jgi:hypothetical protein
MGQSVEVSSTSNLSELEEEIEEETQEQELAELKVVTTDEELEAFEKVKAIAKISITTI